MRRRVSSWWWWWGGGGGSVCVCVCVRERERDQEENMYHLVCVKEKTTMRIMLGFMAFSVIYHTFRYF